MYMTRCIFDAFKVQSLAPPYDTGIARIYYPARYGDTHAEHNSGTVPVESARAPYPVLIMLPGMNTDAASYRWLAEPLASAGIVTVCFQLVAQDEHGNTAATPGIDLQAMTPQHFGSRPSAIAIPAILSMLQRLNAQGVLAGSLDLNRIAFGGHSAGGSVALLNARRDWFPGLRAVFTYGAHSAASTALGWPAQTLLPITGDVPILLLGGAQDGCIAHSAHHYEHSGVAARKSATDRVEQTFEQAVPENGGNNTLLLLHDANHFSLCAPDDPTCGRGFIDFPVASARGRLAAGQAISLFLQAFLVGSTSAQTNFQELEGLERDAILCCKRK